MMKDKHSLQKLQCPYCMETQSVVHFYQCCSRPSCQKCHNSHPSIICKFNTNKENIQIQDNQNHKCNRCLEQEKQVYCSECRCNYCAKCSKDVHSMGKFLCHNLQIGNKEQMVCSKHYRYKNMMSEYGKLKCQICVSQTKDKKGKTINRVSIELVESILRNTESYLINWQENEQQKHKQLKQNIERQYLLIKERIQQKVNSLLSSVDLAHMKSKKSTEEILEKIANGKKQVQIYHRNGIMNNQIKQFLDLRSFFLNQQVNKMRKDAQKLDYYEYKLNVPTSEEIQAVIKSYALQRIKIKNSDDDEKENKSLRKSRISSGKLSCRQQRKSQSKSTTKNNDLSINSKLSVMARVNHDYIKPTLLPFSNLTNKLNKQLSFTNSQTSLTNCQSSTASLISKQDQVSGQDRGKPAYLKRKTDYLDMRDRMRKPSVVNRFEKRQQIV